MAEKEQRIRKEESLEEHRSYLGREPYKGDEEGMARGNGARRKPTLMSIKQFNQISLLTIDIII